MWSEMGKQNVQAEKVYCARDSRYRGIMGIAKEEVRFRNNVYDSASNFESFFFGVNTIDGDISSRTLSHFVRNQRNSIVSQRNVGEVWLRDVLKK